MPSGVSCRLRNGGASPDVILHLLCALHCSGPSHSNGCFAAAEAVDIWQQLMFLIRSHDDMRKRM
jgi:hypothetical protein